MEKCAVIVNTCDQNMDLLDNFFYLFHRFWANCPYRVYINTEKLQYTKQNIQTLYCNQTVSWCKRLRKCIKEINSKYVILLLEDFYLESKVDQDEIDRVIAYMDGDDNIISFCFDPINMDNTESKYQKYWERKRRGKYRHCLQAGIWRTDYLINVLNIEASPWEFEYTYNFLSFNKNYRFYCIKEKKLSPFAYSSGYLVYRGKYVKEEIEKFQNMFNLQFSPTRDIISKREAVEKIGVIQKVIRRIEIYKKQLRVRLINMHTREGI